MYKRIMHDLNGDLSEQAYGKEGQAIYSVSRAELNALMMEMAEKNGAKLHFNEKCIEVDIHNGNATFENSNNQKNTIISADLVGLSDSRNNTFISCSLISSITMTNC